MNKRLAWNFEISTGNKLFFEQLPAFESDVLRWEARYFWPEESIITLSGLDEQFLDLSCYHIKKRQDTYYVLPKHNYNVKYRRESILYKPLIEELDHCQAFGKKIDLSDQPKEEILLGIPPITVESLKDIINKQATSVLIDKVALIYKLPTQPTIKLELTQLLIEGKWFYSVCIEGRSFDLVSKISQHLIKRQSSSDYVQFLKDTLRS